METETSLSVLVEKGCEWLREQRDLYRANARPLFESERKALKGYYEARLLDAVRVAAVDRISNPEFYPDLVRSGNPLLDLSGAAGITLIDCVVILKTFRLDSAARLAILFHELVHVVQYDIMGPARLIEAYLSSWAENGYRYDRISFQMQAQRLEARFDGQERPFSVRQEVERDLREWGAWPG